MPLPNGYGHSLYPQGGAVPLPNDYGHSFYPQGGALPLPYEGCDHVSDKKKQSLIHS